tara:strand:- start:2453 stop:3310 length:858 start_codon:yes stop_codon:yes gene_type:complete
MKCIVGNNLTALLASHIFSDLDFYNHEKQMVEEYTYIPTTASIIDILDCLGLDFSIKSFKCCFDNRGKLSAKFDETFVNIWCIHTRGKSVVEKSYIDNLSHKVSYISINDLPPLESLNILKSVLLEKSNAKSTISGIEELEDYKKVLWCHDLRLLNSGIITEYVDSYQYICKHSEVDGINQIFDVVYSIGKPYYRKIYSGENVIYSAMRKIYDKTVDDNTVLESSPTIQIVDNLRLNSFKKFDLLGVYSQWDLGMSLGKVLMRCNELREYYIDDKKISKNIFISQ